MNETIVGARVYYLEIPLHRRFVTAGAEIAFERIVLVSLSTGSMRGFGEGHIDTPEALEDGAGALRASLIGKRVEDATRFIATRPMSGHRGLSWNAWQTATALEAAADIACWDLAARAAELPLYRLLRSPGAASAYWTGAYGSAASGLDRDLMTELSEYRAAGVTRLKLKVGLQPLDIDLQRVTVAKAAGLRISVDANCAWTVDDAYTFCRSLPDLDGGWVEEPLRQGASTGDWIRLRETGQALGWGENGVGLDALELMAGSRLVDVLQPDPCRDGGISRLLEARAIARSANMRLVPHHCSNIAAHVVDGDGEVELFADPGRSLSHAGLVDPPSLAEGQLRASSKPGAGCEYDPTLIARYRVWSSK